jgi:hypothetical protein
LLKEDDTICKGTHLLKERLVSLEPEEARNRMLGVKAKEAIRKEYFLIVKINLCVFWVK